MEPTPQPKTPLFNTHDLQKREIKAKILFHFISESLGNFIELKIPDFQGSDKALRVSWFHINSEKIPQQLKFKSMVEKKGSIIRNFDKFIISTENGSITVTHQGTVFPCKNATTLQNTEEIVSLAASVWNRHMV